MLICAVILHCIQLCNRLLQVFAILKNILSTAINSPDCGQLARFTNLKAEIVAHSAKTLGECVCSLAINTPSRKPASANYLHVEMIFTAPGIAFVAWPNISGISPFMVSTAVVGCFLVIP
jgi:hypothetical protein